MSKSKRKKRRLAEERAKLQDHATQKIDAGEAIPKSKKQSGTWVTYKDFKIKVVGI